MEGQVWLTSAPVSAISRPGRTTSITRSSSVHMIISAINMLSHVVISVGLAAFDLYSLFSLYYTSIFNMESFLVFLHVLL